MCTLHLECRTQFIISPSHFFFYSPTPNFLKFVYPTSRMQNTIYHFSITLFFFYPPTPNFLKFVYPTSRMRNTSYYLPITFFSFIHPLLIFSNLCTLHLECRTQFIISPSHFFFYSPTPNFLKFVYPTSRMQNTIYHFSITFFFFYPPTPNFLKFVYPTSRMQNTIYHFSITFFSIQALIVFSNCVPYITNVDDQLKFFNY